VLEVENPAIILIGAVIGALYGLPIGLSVEMKQHRRQWWVVFLLMLLVPVTGLFHWSAPLFLLAVIGATIFMTSQTMAPLFEGKVKDAFVHLIKLNLGIWRGFQIIEDGETAFPQSGGRPLGPVLTIVRQNSLAILEGGKTQPRFIIGPSVVPTDRFEYVKKIINLKPKSQAKTVKGCLTKDGMEVDVVLTSLAGLNVSDQTRREPGKVTVFESSFLQKLHLDMPDWEAYFVSVLEEAIRYAISRHAMIGLLDNSIYGTISVDVRRYLETKLKQWGIRTLELTIERITLPTTFVKAKAEAAAAALAMEILAIARRDGLVTMADGYNVASTLGMPDDQINRELLRSTLEQIVRQPSVGALLSPALSAALREMLESLRP